MARPFSGEVPTSAARLSVQLSPEAQQVFNEIMKSDGTSDRSETMDRIVLDYGDKVKGMEPGMLLKTKKGLSEISGPIQSTAMGGDLDEADRELSSTLSTMVKQVRYKQLSKMLGDMEENGSLDLEKLMMFGYVDKLMNREPEGGKGMDDMMPLFLFKMLGSNDGGQNSQTNQVIQGLKDEIKDLKRDMEGKRENPDIRRLEDTLKNMQESKKYDELKSEFRDAIKSIAEKKEEKGEIEKVMPIVEKLEKIKTSSEEKLEKNRDDFQKFRDEVLRGQIDELRREMAGDSMSKKMKGKIEEMLVKGFDKAVKTAGGEKSGAELASELISDTIERVKEPLIRPLAEAMGRRIESERSMQPVYVPVQESPEGQIQQVQVPGMQTNPVNPKSGEFSDLINVSEEE